MGTVYFFGSISLLQTGHHAESIAEVDEVVGWERTDNRLVLLTYKQSPTSVLSSPCHVVTSLTTFPSARSGSLNPAFPWI